LFACAGVCLLCVCVRERKFCCFFVLRERELRRGREREREIERDREKEREKERERESVVQEDPHAKTIALPNGGLHQRLGTCFA